MTSHWNLPPNPMSHPSAIYHPHMPPPPPPAPANTSSSSGGSGGSGGGGGNSKSKYAHLGQYGVSGCVSFFIGERAKRAKHYQG